MGNVFQLTFKSLGHIGWGGYRSQSFLPIALRLASRTSAASGRALEP
jgi:hypothetical protein